MTDKDDPPLPRDKNRKQAKKHPTGNYSVGYCKPPQDRIWKKGQSGNKSGVSKNSKPKREMSSLRRVLTRPISMTEGGVTVQIPAHEAIEQKLLEVALKGNLRAMLALRADARAEGLVDGPERLRLALDWAADHIDQLSENQLAFLDEILTIFVEGGKRAEAAGRKPREKDKPEDVVHYTVGVEAAGGLFTVHRHTSARGALAEVQRTKSSGLKFRIRSSKFETDLTEDELKDLAKIES